MADKLYFVRVKTADESGGGTDSDVYARLFANNGKGTVFLQLDDPDYGDLERGQVDTFIFRHEDFDEGSGFRGFAIYLEPKGTDPPWHLEWIAFGEWRDGTAAPGSVGQVYTPPVVIGTGRIPAGAIVKRGVEYHHASGMRLGPAFDAGAVLIERQKMPEFGF
jgi:hypothetical protein